MSLASLAFIYLGHLTIRERNKDQPKSGYSALLLLKSYNLSPCARPPMWVCAGPLPDSSAAKQRVSWSCTELCLCEIPLASFKKINYRKQHLKMCLSVSKMAKCLPTVPRVSANCRTLIDVITNTSARLDH